MAKIYTFNIQLFCDNYQVRSVHSCHICFDHWENIMEGEEMTIYNIEYLHHTYTSDKLKQSYKVQSRL